MPALTLFAIPSVHLRLEHRTGSVTAVTPVCTGISKADFPYGIYLIPLQVNSGYREISGSMPPSIRELDFGGVNMSADGNLKFGSLPHPPLSRKSQQPERKCAVCKLPFRAHPPVLLKTGESMHVECYFRIQKRARGERPN